MPIDLNPAVKLVSKHKNELPGTKHQQTEYARNFEEQMEALRTRGAEDRRTAVNIAVGASNTLISIAVGVFGVIGGFIQYLFTEGSRWNSPAVLLLMGAGLSILISMIKGFMAISRAYKRGEGREAPGSMPWATQPLKEFLDAQALFGLLSLMLFAGAVMLANAKEHQKTLLTLKVDQQTIALPATGQPVVLEGNWNTMSVKVDEKTRLDLAPVPPGKTRAIAIGEKK